MCTDYDQTFTRFIYRMCFPANRSNCKARMFMFKVGEVLFGFLVFFWKGLCLTGKGDIIAEFPFQL